MAKKYKVAIVGHFADGKDFFDGQTVKTRNLYRALAEHYGSESIKKVDTCGFKRRIFSFTARCIKSYFSAENTIILPAHNGVCIFVPLFSFLRILKKRKLHYAVVGGWLPEFLKKHKFICRLLKKFTGIYVETSSMKSDLEKDGFNNIVFMPNFKYLDVLTADDLVYSTERPLKLCIFSRVMKEKGIEDAIKAVTEINKNNGDTIYSLDIYGPVDDGYSERFEELKANFPDYIQYKGKIPSDQSVQVIKNYFALLFPTRFYTEGVPGTLIDAYAAGVPVISSLWVNHKDVFVEGVTGWGYEFGNVTQFKELLLKAANTPDEFLKMKKSTLVEAEKYKPEIAIKNMIAKIE